MLDSKLDLDKKFISESKFSIKINITMKMGRLKCSNGCCTATTWVVHNKFIFSHSPLISLILSVHLFIESGVPLLDCSTTLLLQCSIVESLISALLSPKHCIKTMGWLFYKLDSLLWLKWVSWLKLGAEWFRHYGNSQKQSFW